MPGLLQSAFDLFLPVANKFKFASHQDLHVNFEPDGSVRNNADWHEHGIIIIIKESYSWS